MKKEGCVPEFVNAFPRLTPESNKYYSQVSGKSVPMVQNKTLTVSAHTRTLPLPDQVTESRSYETHALPQVAGHASSFRYRS